MESLKSLVVICYTIWTALQQSWWGKRRYEVTTTRNFALVVWVNITEQANKHSDRFSRHLFKQYISV